MSITYLSLPTHPSWVLKKIQKRAGILALVHHNLTSSRIESSDIM